jgi:hypothetical protein
MFQPRWRYRHGWPPIHHLAIAPTAGGSGPNWAEIITAIATAILAGGVIAAFFQLKETKTTRNTEMAARLSEKWESKEFADARAKVDSFKTEDEFLAAMLPAIQKPDEKTDNDGADADRALLRRELTYFEEIAALELMGAISIQWIDKMMKQRVLDRWEVWWPIIERLRAGPPEEPAMFANFQKLVDRLNGKSLRWHERLRSWLINQLAF